MHGCPPAARGCPALAASPWTPRSGCLCTRSRCRAPRSSCRRPSYPSETSPRGDRRRRSPPPAPPSSHRQLHARFGTSSAHTLRHASGKARRRVSNSQFVMNQMSGQVLEQVDSWDLPASSLPAQAYIWLSRRVYSTVESGKDTIEAAKSTASGLSTKEDQNLEAYPDPSGHPTKFLQRPDDGFNQDVYQIGLFLAVIYFIVQSLKTTL